MSIIFADDFQQWATAASTNIRAAGLYPQYLGQNVPGYLDEMACFGIFTPSYTQGFGGPNSILYSLYFDTQRGALCIVQPRAAAEGSMAAFASGYRRKISYEGDTLYFGTAIEIGGITPAYSGDFLIFSSQDNPVFTMSDQVGTYSYGVGIDADGFYTFNGVSTTVQAYYKPASVVCYIDVIIGPDYMELWLDNVKVATQTRQNIPIKNFGLTAAKLVKTTNTNFCIWIHSIIVADNSGGFGERIGRKRAKTEQIQSTPVVESSLVPAAGYIALAIIRKFASGPTNETDVNMIGNLSSPAPYVKNEFGVVRASAAQKPHGALVAIQAKRMTPSGDGMSIIPYSIINGTKVAGKIFRPSSTWKMFYIDTPIAPDQTFTAATLGYTHDYKDLNKIFADDRTKVEVYGDKDTNPSSDSLWWKSTDLIAFDSSLLGIVGGNFTDYNGKTITPVSGTIPSSGNLPFRANEPFKYGYGIDLNINGAIFTPLTGIVLTQPHTIDFWFKESVDNVISALLGIYTNTTNTGAFMELHTHDTQTTKMALWNNNATARVISTWDTFKSSTAWRHYAVTYNGTTVSIYIDGVLLGTLTWTIGNFGPNWGLAHRAYWRQDTTSRLIIERYRVRAGVAWVNNFDVETIYN